MFDHLFEPSPSGSNLALLGLHGTGGDEREALNLAKLIGPGANLLGVRGMSTEEGINRYFRRFEEGVFDVADIKAKAGDLADWIDWAGGQYGLRDVVGVGLSNGANMGVALLLERPEVLAGLIGIRAMTPFTPSSLPNLRGKPVLLLSGESDPIVPREDVESLAATLREAGADVQHEWLPTGHSLTREDIEIARRWIQRFD